MMSVQEKSSSFKNKKSSSFKNKKLAMKMNLLLLSIKGLRSFMYCEFISAPVIILLINILVDETVPV